MNHGCQKRVKWESESQCPMIIIWDVFLVRTHAAKVIFICSVCGPWSASKNYNLEYLIWIITSRAEFFPEDSFYVSRVNFKAASSKLILLPSFYLVWKILGKKLCKYAVFPGKKFPCKKMNLFAIIELWILMLRNLSFRLLSFVDRNKMSVEFYIDICYCP